MCIEETFRKTLEPDNAWQSAEAGSHFPVVKPSPSGGLGFSKSSRSSPGVGESKRLGTKIQTPPGNWQRCFSANSPTFPTLNKVIRRKLGLVSGREEFRCGGGKVNSSPSAKLRVKSRCAKAGPPRVTDPSQAAEDRGCHFPIQNLPQEC